MAGKLQFTPEEFKEAATKYRKDLLMLPIIGIQDTLQYMTARPGIRYKENVGALSGDAQFGPYKPSRSTDFNLNVDYRTLETFMVVSWPSLSRTPQYLRCSVKSATQRAMVR